ncbi:Knottin, scorpion toxin-like [Parasponia andersonii]|uniref:Knottin, scorpion toxin-like n=1 Tax=Parasponia andersonii TaxID=3476 RepID=A0A2P5C374_PARAD|nr:Knottin, scorpion toxin-like [Parasponia andersonii]
MLPYVFVLVVIILADHSTTSAGHELEKRCEFYSRTWPGRRRWTPHCKNKCHKKEDARGGRCIDGKCVCFKPQLCRNHRPYIYV